MSLTLSSNEVREIRTSWANLEVNNRYHKDQFTSRLFSNLLISNPQLKECLSTDLVIRDQSVLFNDLLNFAVIYVDDEDKLNDCLTQFFQESPGLINVATNYLEPMGNSLIQTFRQWLGKGKFNRELEAIWIKVYLYLANSILLFIDDSSSSISETSSIISGNESTGTEEEPIAELKITPRSEKRPMPVESKSEPKPEPKPEVEPIAPVESNDSFEERPVDTTRQCPTLNRSSSIQINLKSNDKYRGFRRSVRESDSEPITVPVPTNDAFDHKKVDLSDFEKPKSIRTEEFDPRVRSRSSSPGLQEVVCPPRSPRRNLTAESIESVSTIEQTPRIFQKLAKFNNQKPRVISDDDEVETPKQFGFDPRRKRSIKSDEETSESNVSDVEDDAYNLNGKPEELDATFEDAKEFDDDIDLTVNTKSHNTNTRASVFDSNSFGIKGLQPIMETKYDDGASSVYNSEEENSSSNYGDSGSSSDGTSQLSLHNSDYSDGTEAPNSPTSYNQKGHQTRASQSSDISMMKPLPPTKLKSPSLNDLSREQQSIQSRQRASLGFMRSSFVLKKEIETLGYNQPENVFVKPPTIPAASNGSQPNLVNKQSLASMNSQAKSDDESYDYVNAFMSKTDLANRKKPFITSYQDLSSSVNHHQQRQTSMNARHSKSTSNLGKRNNYEPMNCGEATAAIRPSNQNIGKIKAKRSFRDKIKSFFGGSSSTETRKTSEISLPVNNSLNHVSSGTGRTNSMSKRHSRTNSMMTKESDVFTNRDSISTLPTFETKRTRSHTAIPKAGSTSNLSRSTSSATVNKTRSSSNLRKAHDTQSIASADSTSGFSFFSKRNLIDSKYSTRGDRGKKNKYNVSSVPYDVFAHNKGIFSH